MAAPDYTTDLPEGVELVRIFGGGLQPSPGLVDLFVRARSAYDWPAGTGAATSQRTILSLEATVGGLLALTPTGAHAIVEQVSLWAGNNALSHAAIARAPYATKVQLQNAITLLGPPGGPGPGLDALSALRGLSLVISTKVYRFCLPSIGAAVDRHASYFFNSLDVVSSSQPSTKATHFLREWTNGRHASTRLGIYSSAGYTRNRQEVTNCYLPLLSQIAGELNKLGARYACAATGLPQAWRPADVEMAAYYWWACNGSR